MSTTTRFMPCTPADVFTVLSDGWMNGLWVVGAARIRDVDEAWPAPGAEIHHSFGIWPALIDDTTTSLECEPGRHLKMRARGWPMGEAEVRITLEPSGAGTTVTITEDAVKGPGTLIPRPLRSAILGWRNQESLQRMEFLARNRVDKPDHPRP